MRERACIPCSRASTRRAASPRPSRSSATSSTSLRPKPCSTCGAMARMLADAIAARKRLLIVADYDADGATACAVGMRALAAFGAIVDYLVPNRFEYGYGLTPEIVRLAHERARPDILITVDNGISSFEGVAEANRLGMMVLITDHHLPAATLPDAACIINPNQPGCGFPEQEPGRRGRHVLPDARAARRAAAARLVRRRVPRPRPQRAEPRRAAAPRRARHRRRRRARSTATTASWCTRDCSASAPAACSRASPRCSRRPAAITARATAYDLGFVAGPAAERGRPADRHVARHRMPRHRRLRPRAGDRRGARSPQPASGARSSPTCRRARWRRSDAWRAEDACSLSLFDPGWHQGVVGIVAGAHQGPVSPARPSRSRAATPARSGARGAPFRGCTCATRSTGSPCAIPD